jgi:gamma-glutamyl:cysteine ligase YbdK (ATP-grasp superfamily)
VDLPVLFLALLGEIHEQVSKSHGEDSVFAKTVNNTWQAIMGHGGELDQQYSERGIRRQQQHRALEDQIKELWPKVRAFAADDAMAAQIDEALAG